MSVTKDKKTDKWMAQIRVTDWTGKTIHKKKRGFDTKREAQQWERDFINQANSSLGMNFKDFIGLYMKDMEQRLKSTTVASKHWLIDLKITPFFGRMPLNGIRPTDVRRWQNSLTSYRDEKSKALFAHLPQGHQQPAGSHIQLRGEVLRIEGEPLPQGGRYGQEAGRRDVVLDEG